MTNPTVDAVRARSPKLFGIATDAYVQNVIERVAVRYGPHAPDRTRRIELEAAAALADYIQENAASEGAKFMGELAELRRGDPPSLRTAR